MAFARLEDLRGSIELVIFSDVYERRQPMVAAGKIVAVTGAIDRSRGDPKVKVEDMMEPEEMGRREARAVHIRLAGDVGSEESLLTLREYLLDHRGSCSLYFHLGPGPAVQGTGTAAGPAVQGTETAAGPAACGETLIRASVQLRVSDAEQVLAGIREHPGVVDAWRE
jgi:DNA polymerase III alpha subunit